MLLLLGTVLLIAFSLYLAPVFEQIFREFELSLSPTTLLVIELAQEIRRWWLVVLVIGTVAAAGLLSASIWSRFRHKRLNRTPQFEGLFSSPRAALAQWAWHVALLLEAGLSQANSITVAGQSSDKAWLKRHSDNWSTQIQRGDQPSDQLTQLRGCRIHTLRYALRQNRRTDQIALLKSVAFNYWEAERSYSGWRLSWLAPVTACVIGTLIGTLVAAMFMPLVELINGLT